MGSQKNGEKEQKLKRGKGYQNVSSGKWHKKGVIKRIKTEIAATL